MKRVTLVISIALAPIVGVVAFVIIADDAPVGRRTLMCPPDVSVSTYDDARRFCATRATALASIDTDGVVTRYVEDVGCSIPAFEAVSADMAKVMGHGTHRCDTSTVGSTLYLFPHCSLTLNYPGNEDFAPRMPIGLLVQPYDC